jgi:Protein of unknown function (DUF4199)
MKIIGLPIRFGIAISASLIAFFLTLSLFNAHTSPVYSLFNGVIIAFGIYEAIKSYKLRQGSKFNYTSGFTIGITTGFVATIIFTIFFAFYAVEIDTDFLTMLLEPFKRHEIYYSSSEFNNIEFVETSLTVPEFVDGMAIMVVIVVLSTVAIMGFLTTIVLTLVFMQFLKNSINFPQNQ